MTAMDDPYTAAAARFRIRQETAVRWFDTRQLLATAAKTLAATIIGSMSGRRELMAALDPQYANPASLAGKDEVWLDFLADCGDGWNASMSIAWLIGRDALSLAKDGTRTLQPIPPDCFAEVPVPDALDQYRLPHGALLIGGGDQVYPTASPDGYQHRFIDPFRCARYAQTPSRSIYAIPGNHDWYDGLTSFIRLFCQTGEDRRWIGAWRTGQRRSYFALELPHHTWLWGVDMALEDDLDPPQQEFFRQHSALLRKGDQVILCVPTPTWIHVVGKDVDLDRTQLRMANKLEIIMELARGGAGCPTDVPLVLTGDSHYYARHETTIGGRPRHYIICGGGGAFGLGTLETPETLRVTEVNDEPVTAYCRKTFPDAAHSVALRRGVLRFPLMNWAFSTALAFVQLLLLWLIGGNALVSHEPLTYNNALLGITQPAPLFWLLLTLTGFMAFGASGRRNGEGPSVGSAAGFVHGLLQVVGSQLIVWAAGLIMGAWPASAPIGTRWLAVLAASPLLYLYCGTLFGFYLFLVQFLLRLHDEEVYSSQGIEDYKSFLRIRIGPGGITVYPIGLERIARHWRPAGGVRTTNAGRSVSMARLHEVEVPQGCTRVFDPVVPLNPHLIEAPIFVPARR